MNPYDIEQTPMHFNKKFTGILACILVLALIIVGACLGSQSNEPTETSEPDETTVTETAESTTSTEDTSVLETTEPPQTSDTELPSVSMPELDMAPPSVETNINKPVETLPAVRPLLPQKPTNPDPEVSKNYLTLTESERLIFATLLAYECGGSSYETKMAVASVVINRMNMWNQTIRQVIFAKNQFSPAIFIDKDTGENEYWRNGKRCTKNMTRGGSYEECWRVVDDICENGPSIPSYVLYFRTKYYHSWSTPYAKIGSLYFSYAEKYTSICKYCGERFTKTEIADHRAECSQKH